MTAQRSLEQDQSRTAAGRRNRILGALPDDEYARMLAKLELGDYAQHTTLQPLGEEIDFVYFPVSGVASLIASGSEGEQVDTSIIGNEGMVGLPVFLGTGQMPVLAVVQLEMRAMRMRADDLRQELEVNTELVKLLQRYSQMVLVELAQLVLCNRVHSIEERAARWVLQLHDRLGQPAPFQMTQEFLAAMLASPRPHVSQVLSSLRDRALIDYGRGEMRVTDVDGLENVSCSCYRTIRDELDRLLTTPADFETA